jgi:hypothetical protein
MSVPGLGGIEGNLKMVAGGGLLSNGYERNERACRLRTIEGVLSQSGKPVPRVVR